MCEGCPWIFCLQNILGLKQLDKRRSGIALPLVLVSLFLVTATAEHDPADEQVHKSAVESRFYTEVFPLGNNVIVFFLGTRPQEVSSQHCIFPSPPLAEISQDEDIRTVLQVELVLACPFGIN